LIVNELNVLGSHAMNLPSIGAEGEIWSLDTSGDGSVSALDALLVVNHMNAFGAEPEGESPAEPAPAAPEAASELDLLAILAEDHEQLLRRRRG
jgi:hypothetical protein